MTPARLASCTSPAYAGVITDVDRQGSGPRRHHGRHRYYFWVTFLAGAAVVFLAAGAAFLAGAAGAAFLAAGAAFLAGAAAFAAAVSVAFSTFFGSSTPTSLAA